MNTLLFFTKNTKTYCGYKPHFTMGNNLLFLIGRDYWLEKICKMRDAYKNSEYKVFGILKGNQPGLAKYDWIVDDQFTLLQENPLAKARWNVDRDGIEFIEVGPEIFDKED